MASLMENLIDVLQTENKEYESLIELSRKKSGAIIAGDLRELEKITDEEQRIVSRVQLLENKRQEVMADIGNVLNKDVEALKLTNLIQMLDRSPKEQEVLKVIHDKLKATMSTMKQVNSHNQMLLEQSLEIVDFNLNVMRSMKAAPETANYSRRAIPNGYCMGVPLGGFDAKQ